MNSGILVLRLVLGLLMAAHGSQKLFGGAFNLALRRKPAPVSAAA